MQWPGLLTVNSLPLAVGTTLCRSGIPSQERLCASTQGLLNSLTLLHGLPTVDTLPLEIATTPCSSGTHEQELPFPSPSLHIQEASWRRWPGHLMDAT